MKKLRRALFITFIAVICLGGVAGALAGCGQKGPLYLPENGEERAAD